MTLVLNDLLGRDGLKIYQNPEMFSFSIDSMLLADFVSINASTKRICDLCTGNAPIPLYLTLRTKAQITGVEVQPEAVELANKSIDINNLSAQINITEGNLKNINEVIGKNTYDVVTCNPPFYKLGTHQINPGDKKAIARHELLATLEDIIKEASILLKDKGKFAMVHRPERLTEILELFKRYNIEPKRLRLVYPKVNKDCNHILIEGIKAGGEGSLKILQPLYVYGENDKWTEEVLKIYNFER